MDKNSIWYSKYGRFKKYDDVDSCAHALILLEQNKKYLEKLNWWNIRKIFILIKEIEWLSKRVQNTHIPLD